ncbi:MAG TPA: V-type ATP synthase subunit B, partial [Clostridiales bacterium]|nr:V-type ATP synthase subunit B [Clostridiales bacterium]
PDLTGYITEGQIVLSRELALKGVYPPVGILPSLSRLMKDGTGEGYTRDDHSDLSNQLFASYSEVAGARSLATVIGEDELSATDKLYLKFGDALEDRFIGQGMYEDRSLDETLDLGWRMLSILPRTELGRTSEACLDRHYIEK